MASHPRKPFAALSHASQQNKEAGATTSTRIGGVKVSTTLTKSTLVGSSRPVAKVGSTTRPATSHGTTSTTASKKSAPISSIAALVQQDRARVRQAARPNTTGSVARHLPSSFANSSSLAAAIAHKTIRDAAWSARQERTFVEWMNQQLVGHGAPNALLAEPLIPDALFARHRAAALHIFHSNDIQSTLAKVDTEIDAGRLSLKLSASELTADCVSREELLDLFLTNWTSYWLRLVLETISGFELPKPRTPEITRRFLEELLFESDENTVLPKPSRAEDAENDPDTACASMDAEHRARWELTRRQARARATLKVVLRLLLVADQCKVANIGGGRATTGASSASSSATGPALFKPTATIYATSTLLATFSARFLNEGDCARHLGFLGFRLKHADKPEETVDFSVRNLATDLRDGVRLARLVEVMVNAQQSAAATAAALAAPLHKRGGVVLAHQPLDLIGQMRLPADNDAKKVWNLNLVLVTLRNHVSTTTLATTAAARALVTFNVTAEDLHAGNQARTYSFLWELMLRFDVSSLLGTSELTVEIARLHRSHARIGWQLGAGHLYKPQENLYFGPSEKVQTLLNWVQTVIWAQSMEALAASRSDAIATGHVALPRQLRIENFTSSFRSGVAACLLMHYYYPSLMPLDAITHPTHRLDKLAWEVDDETDAETQDENAPPSNSESDGWVGSFTCKDVFAQPTLSETADFRAARRNFHMLQRCLHVLAGGDEEGGQASSAALTVDSLFKSPTSDTPDERATIAFLTYVCSRLLILAEEIHAVKRIQRVTRAYLVRARVRRSADAARAAERELERQARLKSEALARVAAAAEEAARQKEAAELLAAKKAARLAAEAERERVENEARAKAALAARQARLEAQRREWEALQAAEAAAEEETRLAAEEEERRVAFEAEQARLVEFEAERRFHELEWVSTTLAAHVRGRLARREAASLRAEKQEHDARSTAALRIQCAFRCFVARCSRAYLASERAERLVRARTTAAVIIQLAFRSSRARRTVAHLRALRRAELVRLEAARRESAAVTLQCAFRCFQSRDALQRARHARAVHHECRRRAALRLQVATRIFLARLELRRLRAEEVERIQHAQMLHSAATRIQCAIRSSLARRELALLREEEASRVALAALEFDAACVIQCAWRSFTARCVLHRLRFERVQLETRAAITMQCAVRTFQAKSMLRHLRVEEHRRQVVLAKQRFHAALNIQCAFRSYQARGVLRFLAEERRVAEETTRLQAHCATVIQTQIRAHFARRAFAVLLAQQIAREEARVLLEYDSAVTIQCAFRRSIAVQLVARFRAAKATEDAWNARRLSAAVKLQCFVRSGFARRELAELKHEAALLEQRRLDALEFAHASAAATTVQCAWRSFRARSVIGELRHKRVLLEMRAATTIQCALRSHFARVHLAHLRIVDQERRAAIAAVEFDAARSIQCAFRSFAARGILQRLRHDRFELETHAAVTIQCAVRSSRARKVLHVLCDEEHRRQVVLAKQRFHAALNIQCAFRSYQARGVLRFLAEERRVAEETARLQTHCATVIQTQIRAHFARRAFAALLAEKIAREEARAALEHDSAVAIQCAFRRSIAVQLVARLRATKAAEDAWNERRRRAATMLQCAIRAYLARREVARRVEEVARERARVAARRAAIDAMQAEVRALEARARALAERDAAERRARELVAQTRAASKITQAWRRYTATPTYRAKKLARAHAAATRIQAVVRVRQARRLAQRRLWAIQTVQQCFRGRMVRRALDLVLRKRLRTIGARLLVATSQVTEEMRIGARTKTALEVLLSSSNLSTVLHATQTLDRTTLLLGACCREAVAQQAVPALVGVTKSLNRSKPHLLLLEATLNVLTNLARERTTRDNVFDTPLLVDAITDAAQSYASAPSILLKLTRFLALGVACGSATIRASLSGASNLKRLSGVSSLLERKLQLEQKSLAATQRRTGVLPSATSSASSSSSAGTLKKPLKKSSAPATAPVVPFDHFSCACHGAIGPVASTSAEKVASLVACCNHLTELLQAIQA